MRLPHRLPIALRCTCAILEEPDAVDVRQIDQQEPVSQRGYSEPRFIVICRRDELLRARLLRVRDRIPLAMRRTRQKDTDVAPEVVGAGFADQPGRSLNGSSPCV